MAQGIKAKYLSESIDLPAGTTKEDAIAAMTIIYPEVKNAEVSTDAEGNYVFTVKSSKKG